MSFRTLLNTLRFPSTISLFGITSRTFSSPSASSSQFPHITHYVLRPPSPIAARASPTPLIHVRAINIPFPSSSSASKEEEDWSTWTGMFSEKGYTSIEIDVSAPNSPTSHSSTPSTSKNPFSDMAKVLNDRIRLMGIPFAPIIISEGISCLVTQAFVEDYPASGLVLVNPPPDTVEVKGRGEGGDGWEWPKFGYEPRFPILIIAGQGEMKGLEGGGSRVLEASKGGVGRGGKGVSVERLVDGPRGEKSRVAVERWMDRCGY